MDFTRANDVSLPIPVRSGLPISIHEQEPVACQGARCLGIEFLLRGKSLPIHSWLNLIVPPRFYRLTLRKVKVRTTMRTNIAATLLILRRSLEYQYTRHSYSSQQCSPWMIKHGILKPLRSPLYPPLFQSTSQNTLLLNLPALASVSSSLDIDIYLYCPRLVVIHHPQCLCCIRPQHVLPMAPRRGALFHTCFRSNITFIFVSLEVLMHSLCAVATDKTSSQYFTQL